MISGNPGEDVAQSGLLPSMTKSMLLLLGFLVCCLNYDVWVLFHVFPQFFKRETNFSWPGRSPGRAIVLPPASALALGLASALVLTKILTL